MWVFSSKRSAEQSYNLLCGKEYSVGRQDCDIVITGDKSISRRHASLKIVHLPGNITSVHKPPILTLTDSSKFGSVINGEKIKGSSREVKSGTTIKFGTVDSEFNAVYSKYVVTTSCLDSASKKQCRELVLKMGGHVPSDWRKDCDLLVMSNLSVTIKVICALVMQKAIVTADYLVDFVKSIEQKIPKPNSEHYLPPLAESQLNPNEVSFKADPRRLTLFQGKIFIFLSSKQFKKLSMAVELAGGTPMLLEEGSDDDKDLISGACVMSCSPENDTSQNYTQNAKQWITFVQQCLSDTKRRMIPDSELGYAVLYCSTDKYCNPEVDPDIGNSQGSVQPSSQIPVVLAHNTQVQSTNEKQEARPSTSGITTIPSTSQSHNQDMSQKSVHVKIEEQSQVKEETAADTKLPNKRKRNITPSKEETKANKIQIKEEPLSQVQEEIPKPGEQNKATPSRATRVKREASPVEVKHDQDGDEFAFRRPSKRRRRGQLQDESQEPASASSQLANGRNVDEDKSQKQEAEEIQDRPKVEKQTPLKTTNNIMPDGESKSPAVKDKVVVNAGGDAQPGFIQTKQIAHVKKDQAEHSDLPSKLLQSETVSLVVKRQPQQKQPSHFTAQGIVTWKGKKVRNFKKFKKATQDDDVLGLPVIIGRSDMEFAGSKSQPELEDYFRTTVEEESQRSKNEKSMNEMFEYSHKRKRKR